MRGSSLATLPQQLPGTTRRARAWLAATCCQQGRTLNSAAGMSHARLGTRAKRYSEHTGWSPAWCCYRVANEERKGCVKIDAITSTRPVLIAWRCKKTQMRLQSIPIDWVLHVALWPAYPGRNCQRFVVMCWEAVLLDRTCMLARKTFLHGWRACKLQPGLSASVCVLVAARD